MSTWTASRESILHKRDGRSKVHNTQQYPWTMYGHMTMVYKTPTYEDTFLGSGIMVNSHHVLTAGHNLFSHNNGGIPDEVTFYPGRNGPNLYLSLKAKHIIVDPDYRLNENYDSDLGMLILEEENIGLKTGWARLRIFDDSRLLLGLNANVTGYPYDKFVDDEPYMYTMSGPIKVVHSHRFYYHVDTSKGQSGSGVWVKDKVGGDIINCLGIHTTGSSVEGNGATRINEEKFNKIGKWITSGL